MEWSKFSVSMCVYGKDNPEHFDVAIESIVNQTVVPSEIVLTVDGPIPISIENVIKKYEDILDNSSISFKVIKLEKNVGHGEARRICFDNCTYNYIALMDADDISVSSRFEKQLLYIQNHPKTSVVGGEITEFINSENPRDISNCAGKRIVPLKDKDIKVYMKKRCPMNQVTVMFKKKDIAEVGGYIDWYCEEDYYLWIRLALAGKIFGNVSDNLVNVRVGSDMYRRRGGIEYFKSEKKLQRYMLNKKMIGFGRYFINVLERFILQILMPNSLRGWLFKKLARN